MLEGRYCKILVFSVWVLVLLVWGLYLTGEREVEPYRVALQLSSADPERQALVLRLADQLSRAGNLELEVVAFGPGLSALTTDAPSHDGVGELVRRGVHFQACEQSLKELKRGGGAMELLPVVDHVPSGVVRLADLTREGYTLVAP